MDIANFLTKVSSKKANIGIIGLGYVGLPLMLTCIRKGFRVIGFDTDAKKIATLMSGQSYIKHVKAEGIQDALARKMFYATDNFDRTKKCDVLLICVPTPLNKNREPDMQFITATAKKITKPKNKLIVLESTTYPGTTDEFLRELLERDGNVAGKSFYLAFSPEREDPGNKQFSTQTIPKIVGGYTPDCTKAAEALYGAILDKVVVVSNTRTAEMTKILENTFRSVNIALANELKMVCDAMDIDIWEVINAAATKPFGYMPFYPGPGLGGHCIPIDPFYLTWKAREYDLATRFIELAGEINTSMHHYVLHRIAEALNGQHKAVNGSQIIIVGIAYKKDIDDMRESPALPIMHMLLKQGAVVRFHDPYIPKLWSMRNYDFSKIVPEHSFDPNSIELSEAILQNSDATVIVTNHSNVDYEFIAKNSRLIVDCRNATQSIKDLDLRKKIVKA
jgi:UDP-N-acetyl-D-glucosamine dehydrogenase